MGTLVVSKVKDKDEDDEESVVDKGYSSSFKRSRPRGTSMPLPLSANPSRLNGSLLYQHPNLRHSMCLLLSLWPVPPTWGISPQR